MARKKEESTPSSQTSSKGRRQASSGGGGSNGSGKSNRHVAAFHHRRDKDKDNADIKAQLLSLGLALREVPGDGNCLFRALGDQMEGHMGNHHRHRQDTVDYMQDHREDFQPFVEDDVPFEKHGNVTLVSSLAQLGTYAGNDAIVAFARLHRVTVVIHQTNTPLWQIQGWDADDGTGSTAKTGKHQDGKGSKFKGHGQPVGPQLHIAYHGGDHYDSIRRLGDNSHGPANIRIDPNESPTETKDVAYGTGHVDSPAYHESDDHFLENVDEVEREAMMRSGCTDLETVRQVLDNNCGNLDAAVEDLLALTCPASARTGRSSSTSSSASSSGPASGSTAQQPSAGERRKNLGGRKQMERIRKQERKRAAEERKKKSHRHQQQQQVAEDTLVIRKVQCLNI